MWTKDDYQEHMLGYLAGVREEIERLTHLRIQAFDLNELHTDLDYASEILWWLIEATDADWEGFRYPLEARCNELLRALYHKPYAGALLRDGVSFHPIRSSVYTSATVVRRKPELA